MRTFLQKYKVIFISYLICIIIGTISHFLYDLTNHLFILKPFVSIDESIFEHLKLLFYPTIFISLIESIIIYKNPLKLIPTRTISSTISCILLTIFYYSYTTITKKSITIIDISSYYIFVLISYIISIKLDKYTENKTFQKISYIILFITIIFFSFFTEYKPNNDFFK